MSKEKKPFDIDANSKHLKEYVAKYHSERFVADIATLLTYIDTPRMSLYPFQGLDSPLRQLTYLASLNLSSDPGLANQNKEIENDEWLEMVTTLIKIKSGYFDLLLPGREEDDKEYAQLYKVAMPVFMNYYDTGALNYEEQNIERIRRFFTHFDEDIAKNFGLNTADFLEIYELVDNALFERFNYPLQMIRKHRECNDFWKQQFDRKIHPFDWQYDGNDPYVAELVAYMKNRAERFKVDFDILAQSYDADKLHLFFQHFTIDRKNRDYLNYTSNNPILYKPIYRTEDGRYLIVSAQQLISAIYLTLTDFFSNAEDKLRGRFYKRRGDLLEEKVAELFNDFFKNQCFIYKEYATQVNGDEQDLLVLHKGLALIIEAKAGREAEPMRDVKRSFEKIAQSFKKNIQEGYEQSYRIKRLFDEQIPFDIFNKKGEKLYAVNTKKYHSYFPIIVTLQKFREPQINLDHLLELHDNDDCYPLSICVDDLEIILLAMKKMRKGVGDLIRYLNFREQLQGRLRSNDELEVWGAFMNNKNFKVPDDEQMHFATFPEMGEFYDDLYKQGLGFKNEKNIDKKKSGQYIFFEPTKRAITDK